MEEQDRMTYYFITDSRIMSKDDMLRIERVAAIEASQMRWRLFVKYAIENLQPGTWWSTSVSLN
jgi:hypothetical protein